MKTYLFFFVLLILHALVMAQGNRTLHIGAYPAQTEIYVEGNRDFSNAADYITPAEIPVNIEESSVQLTFFKPGFKDSTINISIPKLDESYLMVILQEETDNEVLERQEQIQKKRTQKNIAKYFMFSSLIPYGVSIFSFVMNANANDKANDIKKDLKNHKIRTEQTERLINDLSDERTKAENYKKATFWSAGIGTAILAIGLYLRF